MDGEILDPCAFAEANRLEVDIDRAEPDKRTVKLGDQGRRRTRNDDAAQRRCRTTRIPSRQADTRRGEQPLIGPNHVADVAVFAGRIVTTGSLTNGRGYSRHTLTPDVQSGGSVVMHLIALLLQAEPAPWSWLELRRPVKRVEPLLRRP